MKTRFIRSLFLVGFLGIGTTSPASLDQLNDWFKRVKKGTECLIKREPCDPEDTKAMYQAAGGIAATLALVASGAMVIFVAKKISRSGAEKETLKNQFFNDVSVIATEQAWNLWRQQSNEFRKELLQLRGDHNEPIFLVALDALRRYIESEKGPKGPQYTKQSWQDLLYHLNLIGGMLHAGAKNYMTADELKDAQDRFGSMAADIITSPQLTLSIEQQDHIKAIRNKLRE